MNNSPKRCSWIIAIACIVVGVFTLRELYRRGDTERVRVDTIDLQAGRIQVEVPHGWHHEIQGNDKDVLHWMTPVNRDLSVVLMDREIDAPFAKESIRTLFHNINSSVSPYEFEDRYVLKYSEELSTNNLSFQFNYWIVAIKQNHKIIVCMFAYSFLKGNEQERCVVEDINLLDRTLPKVRFL